MDGSLVHYDKTKLTQRLSRIAGQVNGVSKMIEEERYCIDILHQMAAVKAALSRVEDAILSDHASHCIAEAIASGSEDAQRRKFNELIELMSKVKK
ncbi:hypothetical protein GCM10011342_29180 [Aquisalinus flavus]|uniref:Transcriptional regulator n=1 Tax=Aquisalinus flavus TaxID=1526572 RepID=A0A8J2V7E8_9PROT|nr:metal-sensitive transcriptional regulator [Aquisalinus flavus]MBD0428102.1 metal-sensitive transcriptional regulator [Aquisalinus flavus]GGD18651.1 hypothetical protein GCM10011342_29180 [Aquisalinus flavus]